MGEHLTSACFCLSNNYTVSECSSRKRRPLLPYCKFTKSTKTSLLAYPYSRSSVCTTSFVFFVIVLISVQKTTFLHNVMKVWHLYFLSLLNFFFCPFRDSSSINAFPFHNELPDVSSRAQEDPVIGFCCSRPNQISKASKVVGGAPHPPQGVNEKRKATTAVVSSHGRVFFSVDSAQPAALCLPPQQWQASPQWWQARSGG